MRDTTQEKTCEEIESIKTMRIGLLLAFLVCAAVAVYAVYSILKLFV